MIPYSERIKAAELLYKVANEMGDKQCKKTIYGNIVFMLTDACSLTAKEKTSALKELPNNDILFTATEIGKMFNVSPAKVGQIANANNLKVPKNGIWVYEKAKYSNEKFWTFKYNNMGVLAIQKVLDKWKPYMF